MDVWDWLKGLKRWWWMLVLLPLVAGGIAWVAAPEPKYETNAELLITFSDPNYANSIAMVDFVVLDDMEHLLQSGVLGDILYLQLPESTQADVDRWEFGDMFTSRRHARFVSITFAGDDPETVNTVANTVLDGMETAVNHYLIPPDYRFGAAEITLAEPLGEPALNPTPRYRIVGAVTAATFLVALAATGVAEWLRLSHRAKYDSR